MVDMLGITVGQSVGLHDGSLLGLAVVGLRDGTSVAVVGLLLGDKVGKLTDGYTVD